MGGLISNAACKLHNYREHFKAAWRQPDLCQKGNLTAHRDGDIQWKYFIRKAPVTRDTTPPTILSLWHRKKALMQTGIGSPDMDQKIIIDDIDTVSLRTDKRVSVKKTWLSNEVTATVW